MGKFKKLLIGAVAGALILVVSFVGTLLWMQSKSEAAKDTNTDTKKETKKDTKKEKTATLKLTEPITSNISGGSSINVRVMAELEYVEDKKFVEELEGHDGAAIAAIISVLRSKTLEEVSAPNANVKIAEDALKAVNKAYGTDKFTAVYFREYITQ